MRYQGSCHCGAVRFEAEGELAHVIECNCSHCSRKGLLLWFVPRAQFELKSGEEGLCSYRFHTHRIEHRFCAHCGTQPCAYGTDASGAEMVAVNVRCLEEVEIATLKRQPYDGRSM